MSAPQRWITDKYIYVMLLIFPLFIGFDGYSEITASKHMFMLVSAGLWLAALVFFCIRRAEPPPRPKGAQITALVFFGTCCLSALFSEFGAEVLVGTGRYDGLVTIAVYLLIFLGVSAYGRPKRPYVYALGISTFLTCLVALVQLFGKNALWLFPNNWCFYDAHVKYTSEFLGTIGNTNLLSGFLCLSIPLLSAAFITGRDKLSVLMLIPAAFGVFILTASKVSGGIVGLLGCALIAAPVIISGIRRLIRALFALSAVISAAGLAMAFTAKYENGITRVRMVFGLTPLALLIVSALLSLFALLLLAFRDSFDGLTRRKIQRFMLIISLAVIILGLAFLYFYPFGEGGTLYEISRVLHGDIQDDFGSKRIMIWRRVLELVPEHPLLGGGPDTLARRLDLTFSRYIPEQGRVVTAAVDNAHNEYLGHLANVGLLGLASYLSLMGLSIFKWIKRRDLGGLSPAIGCALVCNWIQGLFGLGLCIVAPVMWILWGLLESNTEYKGMDTHEEEKS